jgi:hypothetical protein
MSALFYVTSFWIEGRLSAIKETNSYKFKIESL